MYLVNYIYLHLSITVMIFDDWKENKKNVTLSPALLWEYSLSDFDWDYMRTLVVGRVIERGRPDDFYAAIRLYGGLENFIEIIKEVPELTAIDMAFVCTYFDLKKEELRCYTRKQSRERLLNS